MTFLMPRMGFRMQKDPRSGAAAGSCCAARSGVTRRGEGWGRGSGNGRCLHGTRHPHEVAGVGSAPPPDDVSKQRGPRSASLNGWSSASPMLPARIVAAKAMIGTNSVAYPQNGFRSRISRNRHSLRPQHMEALCPKHHPSTPTTNRSFRNSINGAPPAFPGRSRSSVPGAAAAKCAATW